MLKKIFLTFTINIRRDTPHTGDVPAFSFPIPATSPRRITYHSPLPCERGRG